MPRKITDSARDQSVATRATPINILKIYFGSVVGVKYYSDRAIGNGDGSSILNAAERVLSWGNVSFMTAQGNEYVTSDSTISLVLKDEDLTLYGYFLDEELQNKHIIVYQYFESLGAAHAQAVIMGIISGPPVWIEEGATFSISCSDLAVRYNTDIGTVISLDDLPYVEKQEAQAVIPMLFGSVTRSKCVGIHEGVTTKLIHVCGETSTQIFVEDSEQFPQNTPITIRIDSEILEGSFLGNTFHVTSHGGDIFAGTVDIASDPRLDRYMQCWNLGNVDDMYRGYTIKWERSDIPGSWVGAVITAYDSDTKTLHWGWPHSINYGWAPYAGIMDPPVWGPGNGQAFTIYSRVRTHKVGAIVFLDCAYKYIVSDQPCADVSLIETYCEDDVDEGDFSDTTTGWRAIDPGLYSLNKNDTSVFGSQHPVTTVEFPRNQREFYPKFEGIFATVEGFEDVGDGSGSMITDPAEIIKEILTRFAKVPAGYINNTSFTNTSTIGTSFLTFGFVLSRVINSIELCADIAFQARCLLLWQSDEIKLAWITEAMSGPQMTLGRSNIVKDSLQITTTPFSDIYTEINAAFYPDGKHQSDTSSITATDVAAMQAYGRRTKAIDLWMHTEKAQARMITSFWLTRWSFPRQIIEFSTYLTAYALQCYDTFKLDWSDFFMTDQLARVRSIDHKPGSYSEMDMISITAELPIEAGCDTICEVACEAGAETGCLTSCEVITETCWQCETGCETPCQLFCTTSAEIGCSYNDAGCGETGTGCEACETGVQTGCDYHETSCDTECVITGGEQTGCWLGLETGCESCETLGCQSGCQSCETSCQDACTAGCTTECEIESDQTSCTYCETVAQTGDPCTDTICGETGPDMCIDCTPELQDTYCVTISGAAGDFAEANGSFELAWDAGCRWKYEEVIESVKYSFFLVYYSDEERWYVTVVVTGYQIENCQLAFKMSKGNTCTPQNVVVDTIICKSFGCSDSNSCANSVGATAVVSLACAEPPLCCEEDEEACDAPGSTELPTPCNPVECVDEYECWLAESEDVCEVVNVKYYFVRSECTAL